ncbi:MAG: carbohydrate-binding family 9-like protein [Bacteroidota bacterium]|nr:carbohydrate-binding family 9-like protein [Bacteroidota bacterium]MDP4191763.1 carbohydrate-binding family 9-like protein [Bacteroidota bacterium]
MIKHLLSLALVGSVCLAQELPIPQIEYSPKKYICYNSGGPIKIDGKLDEAAWAKAEWTDDFVDIEGSVRPTPRFRTRAKMLWDDNYFYIAAQIEEPDIWGTVKNHDEVIFQDNDFEIFIDPDANTHAYAEFEMNALNTVWELLLLMPYRDTKVAAVNGWDIKGLKTAVSIDGTINDPSDKDKGWFVEIAFPWASFKEISDIQTPPNDFDQWRLNFSRVEWKTETKNGQYQKQINPETNRSFPEDNWVWSPQGVVNMHYPEMWGYVQFSKETVGGKKVDFVQKKQEAAKWLLRQIYYKERNYFEKNQKFTTNLDELGIKQQPVPGYVFPPVIELTTDMFEASLKSEDGIEKINIRNDGYVWSTQIKK